MMVHFCNPFRRLAVWSVCVLFVEAQWVHFIHWKRAVDPASANAALVSALPSSIQDIAITNPSAAASIISSEFAAGVPTWFTKLPGDVQTYFLTAGAAKPTAGSGQTNSTATGKFNTGTVSATGTTKLSTTTGKFNISTVSATGTTKLSTTTGSSDSATKSSTTFPTMVPTSASNGLSLGAKAGIGASIPVAVIAFAGFGFWLFFRRKRKSSDEHGQDLAESRGPMNGGHDADLPEVVEEHPAVNVQRTSIQGRGYDSSLLSANTAGDSASGKTQINSAIHHSAPDHIHELDSTPTLVSSPQLADSQPRQELGVADAVVSSPMQYTTPPASSASASGPSEISRREDEEVSKLEAEYVNLKERRHRLLEINRLDEEERKLKQRIEQRRTEIGD